MGGAGGSGHAPHPALGAGASIAAALPAGVPLGGAAF